MSQHNVIFFLIHLSLLLKLKIKFKKSENHISQVHKLYEAIKIYQNQNKTKHTPKKRLLFFASFSNTKKSNLEINQQQKQHSA